MITKRKDIGMRASIIVLTYNQLEIATKPCIESIYKYTPIDEFELIIVDNASSDDTIEYLNSLLNKFSNIKVKFNEVNRGYAGGINDGLRLAVGEYIILLNNDTLVTPNWLNSLLHPLQMDLSIGLVSPISNSVGNEQEVQLRNLTEENYILNSEKYIKENKEYYFETNKVGFFCVATRRDVVEKVGFLDEQFGIGMFEDDDYCLRVKKNGYKIVITESCFIYHKGSVSFKALTSEEYDSLSKRNKMLFFNKNKMEWVLSDIAIAFLEKFSQDLDKYCQDNLDTDPNIERIIVRMDSFQRLLLHIRKIELGYSNIDQRLLKIENSMVWKITNYFIRTFDKIGLLKILRIIKKALQIIRKHGFKALIIKISKKLKKIFYPFIFRGYYKWKLNRILSENKDKPIIIFAPIVDWNIPLFQRPQHIALNMSRNGYLYFYCTNNDYDNIYGFKKVNDCENLYITDQYNLLRKISREKIFHVYAQDINITSQFIEKALSKNNLILYEYIDALHEDLSTSKDDVFERHIQVLKNEKCIVIATADKLYNEVKHYRNKNMALVTNGVEYEHFRKKQALLPDEMKKVVDKNKPIVGYYGALAKWFDYELIIELAIKRPNYEIVLIGWNYDNSMNDYSLDSYDNITIIGPIDYKVLPNYAYWFDISTIPFKINEITESTSPIKVFEYMALGHPIVTSDLPECRKYKSVIVAENKTDFITKIDQALLLKNDPAYKELINKEALENTWEAKAKVIVDTLRSYESSNM